MTTVTWTGPTIDQEVLRKCSRCGEPLSPEVSDDICGVCRMKILCGEPREEPADIGAQRVLGDFELIEEIATGGMGIVYRARQISLNRMVALKTIRSGSFATKAEVRRLHTEAEAAGNLDHPNIVPIYEIREYAGQHFFAMKLVEGKNLADELQGRSMAPRRAAELMVKVAHAVHHAHQRGILHRDLKPRNILIDQRGEPQIADFGLAKLLQKDETTQTDGMLGTPLYMAPEQIVGHSKDLTTAADVYALGGILYTMLTAQPPFAGGTGLQVMRKVVEEEPQKPGSVQAGVDRDLETICLKCLAKRPQERYDAEGLAADLQRWLRHEPIAGRPATVWHRSAKWLRRHMVFTAFAVLAAIATVSFVTLVVVDNRRSQRPAGMKPRCPNLVAVLEPEKLNARFRIPDARGSVLRRAQDEPAIRAEFGPADMIVML